MYFRKDQAKSRNYPVSSYRSIDPAVRERVKKQFDISSVLTKEHTPFMKYPAIHELEERPGVDLRRRRRIKILPAILFTTMLRVKDDSCIVAWHCFYFYSVLMDGSTDNSQVENEQFMFLFCKRYNKLQEIKTCGRYFLRILAKKG